MLTATSDIGRLYHNSRTHPIHGCCIQFLYARFAWSIFPAITGFFGNAVSKAIIAVKNEVGRSRHVVDEVLDVETLGARAAQSRSRNLKRRQRVPGPLEAAQGDEKPCIKRQCKSFLSLKHTDTIDHGDSESSDVSSNSLDTESSTQFPTGPEVTRLEKLGGAFLVKQRSPGFVPFKESVFEGTSDPMEIFARLDYEMRDEEGLETL